MKTCQCGNVKFLKKEEDIQYDYPSGTKIVKEMIYTCTACGEKYVKMGEDYDIEIKYRKE